MTRREELLGISMKMQNDIRNINSYAKNDAGKFRVIITLWKMIVMAIDRLG